MQVMLLAAGRSTRLGALGESLPKPLVPVCGFAPIVYGLSLIRGAGLTDVVVNLHHHGDRIRTVLGDGTSFGVRIQYSEEPDLLGTGGGLVKARSLFKSEPVLVMNAKVIADVDLTVVIAAFRAAAAGTVAAMVLRDSPDATTFAPVEMDESGRVVAMRGRSGRVRPVGTVKRCMFTGIHVVSSALLDRLPGVGVSDVVGDAYLPALEAGDTVIGIPHTGYFAEHSTPERYLDGNLALLRNPNLVSTKPGTLVGIDPSARIHASATVEGPVHVGARAEIGAGAVVGPEVVVGADARVAAGARLQRTVVWPGVTVHGEHRDAVIMDDGVVGLASK